MKIKLLLLFAITQVAFAQQRTCGMQQKLQETLSNPELKKQREALLAKFEVELKKIEDQQAQTAMGKVASPTVTLRIPVAVHFPEIPASTSSSDKTCLRNLAQTQIDVINADYNATNSDISNWSSVSSLYPMVTSVGNMNVQFVIATQNHPAGTGLVNGDKAITFGTDFLGNDENDTTWAGYMNFVIKDIGTQLLGYSPYPGTPSNAGCVVMNTTCYGSGSGCSSLGYVPTSPYNLGRTVTHELGHFFNLDHTFANDNGCGGTDDDGVADTPRCGYAQYGCPTPGSVAGCVSGQKQLTMNYMDYTNDACMYMFTQGQANRVLAYLNTIYSQYHTNTLSSDEINTVDFVMYPNPSNGEIKIKLSNLQTEFSARAFDYLGRSVDIVSYSTEFEKAISFVNPTPGVYFVTISTSNGETTKKIIIR